MDNKMFCNRCGGGFEEKEKIVNSGKFLIKIFIQCVF